MKCSCPPYSLDLAPYNLWLFSNSKVNFLKWFKIPRQTWQLRGNTSRIVSEVGRKSEICVLEVRENILKETKGSMSFIVIKSFKWKYSAYFWSCLLILMNHNNFPKEKNIIENKSPRYYYRKHKPSKCVLRRANSINVLSLEMYSC